MEREIAVVVSNDNKEVSIQETINAIKLAGFKEVFLQWYDKDWQFSQLDQLNVVRGSGLKVIFAHLGYQGINNIWLDNLEGDALTERYKADLDACKENNISMVVMHLTSKDKAPNYGPIGLKRLQVICDYAQSLDIKVAFENTKVKGYQEYIIDNIHNENVGICFDSGHYHAHFNDELDFSKFKDKIFAVHLHDNFGQKDQHLLPFDGTLDWNLIIKNLKDCNYNGPITMELCYKEQYLTMSVEDFYKKGYEVGKKLQSMFED